MVADSQPKEGHRAGGADIMKFLCSYGGAILPRSGDGELRYVGGLTRVLAADRSVSFAELMVKLREFCGYSVELRCQLPGSDLETLVSVKADDELAFLVEEYDRSCPGSKIRAVLSSPKSLKTISPSSSAASSVDLTGITLPFDAFDRRLRRSWSPPPPPTGSSLGGCRNHAKLRYYPRRVPGPEACCRWNYHYQV